MYTGVSRNTTLEFFFGPGFILAWLATGLMIVADAFQWLSANKMREGTPQDHVGGQP